MGDNWYSANGRQLVECQWETTGTVPVGDNSYSASGRQLVQCQWETTRTVPMGGRWYSSREYAREPAPLSLDLSTHVTTLARAHTHAHARIHTHTHTHTHIIIIIIIIIIIVVSGAFGVTADQTRMRRCVHTPGRLRQQLCWPSALSWLGLPLFPGLAFRSFLAWPSALSWLSVRRQAVTVAFPPRFGLRCELPASKRCDLLQDAPSL